MRMLSERLILVYCNNYCYGVVPLRTTKNVMKLYFNWKLFLAYEVLNKIYQLIVIISSKATTVATVMH